MPGIGVVYGNDVGLAGRAVVELEGTAVAVEAEHAEVVAGGVAADDGHHLLAVRALGGTEREVDVGVTDGGDEARPRVTE